MFIPFLDHLISQIELRFSERNTTILNAFYVLPTSVVSDRDWRQMFARFLELNEDDLPEPRYISTELAMWEEYWYLRSGTPPSNPLVHPLVHQVSFPNIYVALQIMATVPVTTCTCERSISVLRRLKSYLRNTMAENRLNGLAMLHIHREITLNIDKVIERFARKHPKRMKLVDILNSDPPN